MPTEETLLRATLRWLRESQGRSPPGSDEDIHPARLDPAERDLDLALVQREEWERRKPRRG